MKEYPYIGIILYEFYETMRKDLIKDEMFFVTNVYEEPKSYSPGHGVYGVRFIKEKWNSEPRSFSFSSLFHERIIDSSVFA